MAAAAASSSSQSQNSAPIAMSQQQQQQQQPSRLARGSSFRIPMPPSSPNPGAAAGAAAAGAASPPIQMAGSPSSGALSSSFSGGGRLGGLVQGFRRARGQSTTRGTGNAAAANNDPNLPPPPSPPVSSAASPAFPTLAASTSLNDFGPSSPYFDGDHHGAGAGQSSHHNNSQQQYTPGGTSTSLTGRGFMRRGFGRKNTAGFLGSGAGGGGQRTPTGEVPPPLIRNRSSSQPSLPLAQDHPASPAFQNTPYSANALPGQVPSFFPAQPSPAIGDTGTPAQERADPLAAPAPNVATTSSSIAAPAAASASSAVAPAPAPVASTSATASAGRAAAGSQHIRLVPHLDNSSARSLSFEPVSRDVQPTIPLRIGRFTDRNPNVPVSSLDQNRVAFKSKVVSRTHAEIWYDPAPPAAAGSGSNGSTGAAGWFIRDLKSSSGTFLNHIRLAGPGIESRPFPLRDGDVLQLGVDYQGGTEEIYRCVKMRVELNRGWQRGVNSFNSSALAQIRAFGNVADEQASSAPMSKDKTKKKKKNRKEGKTEKAVAEKSAASAAPPGGVTDCCICLFSVTVYQALFIAPCSHIFHFKCIRPLLVQHHPGFSCPLCRTFADLEADVEQDDIAEPVAQESSSSGEEEEVEEDDMEVGGSSSRPSLEAREAPVSAMVDQPSLDAGNLDTLRPGKRSPAVGPRSSIGDRPGLSPRASQDSSRSQGPSTPAAGRVSSSSFRRDGLSQPRGASPAASLGAASPGGAGGSAGDFHPPSAGDFEADIRRSSIYVQGAGGMASVIPITGRSRPGSVYEADMSDSNIAIGAGAAAATSGGTPTPSSADRNRARSVRSLRMSTNSIGSLRQVAQGQGQVHGQLASSGSENVPHLEASHPARVGSMVSQYHDFPDSDDAEEEDGDGGMAIDDNHASPPNTARPGGGGDAPRLFPVPDSASQAGTSPASVFTAPMSAGTSLTTEGLPVTGPSSGESSLPGAQAAKEDEQAITPPSSNLDHEGGTIEKGKAKDTGSDASAEGPATLPGGLEDMEAPVDGERATDFVARPSDGKDNNRVTRASARANELA